MIWQIAGTVAVLALVVALAGLLASLILRRKSSPGARPRRRGEGPNVAQRRRAPVSLAVLLARPLELDEDFVAAAAQRAWGALPAHDDAADIAFAGPVTSAVATLQVRGHVFAVISIGEPYTKDRDWYVREDTPVDLVAAWESHRAWLSVDLVYAAPEGPGGAVRDSDEIFSLIAKLLAELVGGEAGAALAAFRPAKRHAIIYDDETQTLLKHTSPLKVITGPIVSLALLESAARTIDGPQLLAAARKAWDFDVAAQGSEVVAMPEPGYGILAIEGIRFAVIVSPRKYGEDFAPASDARLREALAHHTAWLSVDLVEAPVGVTRQRVYDLMGRLLAQWLRTESLLVYAPEDAHACLVKDNLAEKLRGGGEAVLAALQDSRPPVLQIGDDDPRMAGAVAEARQRFGDFVAAFSRRRPDQHFAIKRRFAEGDQGEFMWVRVTAIAAAGDITGVLDNEPYRVRDLKMGDQVSCPVAEIVDWLYTDGAKVEGNFTAAALMAAEQDASK